MNPRAWSVLLGDDLSVGLKLRAAEAECAARDGNQLAVAVVKEGKLRPRRKPQRRPRRNLGHRGNRRAGIAGQCHHQTDWRVILCESAVEAGTQPSPREQPATESPDYSKHFSFPSWPALRLGPPSPTTTNGAQDTGCVR